MAKLTLPQIKQHLIEAANILRGKVDATEFKDYILAILFLKRTSDQFDAARDQLINMWIAQGRDQREAERMATVPALYQSDIFYVPEQAHWEFIKGHSREKDVGSLLNKAITALTHANSETLDGVFQHIDFTRRIGQTTITDKRLQQLIDHFDRVRLRNDNLEFPDLLSAACEYLIAEFAESAGKKGGEFFTPRNVARMMVRLIKPGPDMRVYDPCAGSGSMLIHAKEYIDEHDLDSRGLILAGQEISGRTWAFSKINLILHGLIHADLQNEDTLTDPRHEEDGELIRFHRVLANPPFSANYSVENMRHKERFTYGFAPESGKKADLMFVQHVLAVLAPDGMGAMVMPHGILFRGGKEKEIREAIVRDDRLEAVIGLAPNLFYGISIPACILILRGTNPRPAERQGKIIFINADREFISGRAQNYLDPQHMEKIVAAYEEYRNIPDFARIVSVAELAENDFNLNIRRYVDNTPPPEPQDVRAHLYGGIPKSEVEAKAYLFQPFAIDPESLFSERDSDYYDFLPEGWKSTAERLPSLTNAAEARLRHAFFEWWDQHSNCLVELPNTHNVMETRRELIDSFIAELLPLEVLDRYELAGIIAAWWDETQYDLKALAVSGFDNVIEGWLRSIESAFALNKEEIEYWDKQKAAAELRKALDHRIVFALIPSYKTELEEATTAYAELNARLKAATRKPPAEEGEADVLYENQLPEIEIKNLRSRTAAARKKIGQLENNFLPKLHMAVTELDIGSRRNLVLTVLKSQLFSRLESRTAAARRLTESAFLAWANKYAITLADLEAQRVAATARLETCLNTLGYMRPS